MRGVCRFGFFLFCSFLGRGIIIAETRHGAAEDGVAIK